MISKELFERCIAEIGIDLPQNAFDLFDAYAKELLLYNEKVNLTAITDADGIVVKHFADSLYLLKYVTPTEGAAVCDVGTGAGFPGMCLKLARPDLQVTLFDSVNKKLEFLRFLSRELGLPTEIVHIRAEEAGQTAKYREHFDLATARAVASLNKLCEYCLPLVKAGGLFAPLKAPVQEQERRQGSSAAKILGGGKGKSFCYQLPNGDAREMILYKKESHTSAKYPRVSAQIAKSPLI